MTAPDALDLASCRLVGLALRAAELEAQLHHLGRLQAATVCAAFHRGAFDAERMEYQRREVNREGA